MHRLLAAARNDGADENRRLTPAYAASVADTVLADYARQRRPEWARLKRQLVYLCETQRGPKLFSRWQAGRETLVGLAAWTGRRARSNERLARVCADPRAFLREVHQGADASTLTLPELLKSLLTWLDTPVDIDALTSLVAAILGLEEPVTTSLDAIPEDRAPVKASDEIAELLDRMASETFRRAAWAEICSLLPRQQAALLLGMEREEIVLLAGGARGLKEALGLDEPETAQLWSALPLPDARIARRLAATVQQVSNLRKCARERLARRILGNRGGEREETPPISVQNQRSSGRE